MTIALVGHARNLLRALRRAEAGNVALVFALALVPVVGMMGAAVDYSRANSVKAAMQAALDATALAMARNSPLSSMTQAQLNSSATATFTALFNRPYAQNLSVTPTFASSPASALTLAGSATVPTLFMSIVGIKQMNVATSATVTYAGGKTLSINLVLDSSASMIVGSTAADQTAISNWMAANWNTVYPIDPAPFNRCGYSSCDTPPCAFACHLTNNTQPSDIAMGLTNAHTAGATTRFDVMVQASQQLISHVQSVAGQSNVLFNVLSFDDTVHTWGSSNMSFSGATSAVNSVSPGLNTHLSQAMTTLISKMGQQGSGSSAASPIKFMVLVTDGLQSDWNNDWNCSRTFNDHIWNWNPTCANTGSYPGTIQTSQCQQIKNNGIILAVLETPYVPLTGQNPGSPVGSQSVYEGFIRHFIYPNGPNTASTVSQALQACATPGYYYQAATDAAISSGFVSLADKFINSIPYLSK
jgi:Flp pilus assembly protein TadG